MNLVTALSLGSVLSYAPPATPDVCGAGASAPVVVDSSYRALYESGKSFGEFLATAERRKEQWERNFKNAVVPDALAGRARSSLGPWKVLVVAVDGCSDSVNTVPYLAKLIQQLVGFDMRIVGNDVGRWVMDSHKTPDGRGATPTVILLDANYAERGCWIERPVQLQQFMAEQKGKADDDAIFSGKMKWYDDDKGHQTLEEIVAIMEQAAAGKPACASNAPR